MPDVLYRKMNGGRLWHRMRSPESPNAACKQYAPSHATVSRVAPENAPPSPACPECGRITLAEALKEGRLG